MTVQDEGSVEIYKGMIREKDIWLKRLFIITCTLVVVLVGVLIFDVTHPLIGFIRR